MNTNHQIFTSPLSVSQANNIHRKAALQTSLVLTFALMLLSTLLALTSCESPINIDTPRNTTADVVWQNNDKGNTSVLTVGGVTPEAVLQIERTTITTNGTLYATGFVTSTLQDSSDIGKLIQGMNLRDLAGYVTFEKDKYPLTVAPTDGDPNDPSNLAKYKRILVNFGIYTASFDGSKYTYYTPLQAWAAQTVGFEVNGVSFTNNKVTIPAQPKFLSLQENGFVSQNSDITIQLDKAAEEGVETEVIFTGRDFRIAPVIIPVPSGSSSVVLKATDVKDYLARSGGYRSPVAGLPGSFGIQPLYVLTIRAKKAVSVNNGKVVLAAISKHGIAVDIK